MRFAQKSLQLLFIMLSHQAMAIDYKGIFMGMAIALPFNTKLSSVIQKPKKERGKGASKVSHAEELFIRQVLEEHMVPDAKTVNIDYSSGTGWCSIPYDQTIEVPNTGEIGTAFIRKEGKTSAPLIEKYHIIALKKACCFAWLSDEMRTMLIQVVAASKYIDMELAETLRYKDFLTKYIEYGIISAEEKKIYQQALANIEKSLEIHKGAILHEYGHIAGGHKTRQKELSNFLKYALPGYVASVCVSAEIEKCMKPERLIVPIIASFLCSQIVVKATQLYIRRKEEAEADTYILNQKTMEYWVYFVKMRRIILHHNIKRMIGEKCYSKLCKNKCIERFFNFVVDREHPSLLARMDCCKKKLKKKS